MNAADAEMNAADADSQVTDRKSKINRREGWQLVHVIKTNSECNIYAKIQRFLLAEELLGWKSTGE